MARLPFVITERNDPYVRYKITHEDGRVEHGHMDASEYIEEARQRNVSLASVIAAALAIEGLEPVEEQIIVSIPDNQSVDPSEVSVESPVRYALPEHEHPHSHDTSHEHPHEHPHEHDLAEHGHKVIDARLSALSNDLSALNDHRHPHEHGEIQALTQRVDILARAVQELSKLLEGHNHPQYVLYERRGEHEHKEFNHEHEPPEPHNHPHEHEPDAAVVDVVAALQGRLSAVEKAQAAPHYHPDIVRMVSNAAPAPKASPTGSHIHSFDTMRDDGRGWVCGACGVSKSEVESAR